jgi:outer membrane protein W
MMKYLLCLLFVPSLSFADDVYRYKIGDGCVLKKFVDKAFVLAPPEDVANENLTLTPSRANAEYSNFKVRNSWYAAKTMCFEKFDATLDGSAPAQAMNGNNSTANARSAGQGLAQKKGAVFAELRGNYVFLNGSSATATEVTSGTTTENISKAKSNIGGAARAGYDLSESSDLFLEAGFNTINQANTVTLSPSSTPSPGNLKDKIFSVNVGYQHFFAARKKFNPFVTIAVGYNKLSGALLRYPENITYTGSSIGGYLEFGAVFSFNERWGLVGSVDYSVINFSNAKIDQTSDASTYPSGSTLAGTDNDGGIGINLGLRFQF